MQKTAFDEEIARLRRYLDELGTIGSAPSPVRETVARLSDGIDALESAGHRMQQAGEERLRTAISHVPIFVFNQDRDLRYTWVYNTPPAFSESELIGKTDADLFSPDVARELTAIKRRVLDTGEGARREVRVVIGERSEYYELTIEPVYGASGEITGISGSAHDITGLKGAEMSQKEANVLLEAIFDSLADIVGVMLPDHTVLRYNRQTYDLLGMTPEEVAGKKCYELIGRRVPCAVCATDEAIAAKERRIVEKYVPELGMYLECRSSPVLDDQGNVTLIIEQLYDVSRIRQVVQELERANAYNRSLIEASLDPFVIIDNAGKVTDVNAEAEAVTGYSREEFIGMDFAGYFSNPDEARAGYRKAFEKGRIRDYPLEIRHRDGRRTPVLFNASVYRDESGEVAGVFAAARDITELKRAERCLREGEERFRNIFENSPIGITYFGADGRLQNINAAGVAIFGAANREALADLDLYEDELIPNDRWAELDRGSTLHYILPFDFDGVRKRDQYATSRTGIRRLDMLITPIRADEEASPGAYLVQFQDITEKVETENLRRQAFDQITQNIEQFAVLGDHIRHPLQVIQARADLLECEPADTIREQVRRINQIVRQLDQGWIESRKIREFLQRNE